MAATLDLSARLESFDVSDTSSVGQRWTRWKQSFDYYIMAGGLTDAQQKKALLLHLAGPAVQDIFEILPETDCDDVYEKWSVHLMLIFSHV